MCYSKQEGGGGHILGFLKVILLVCDKWFDCRTGESRSCEPLRLGGLPSLCEKGQMKNMFSFASGRVFVNVNSYSSLPL